jgi:hydroxyethylthiazole kinase-like uncharacterized protein yjeF
MHRVLPPEHALPVFGVESTRKIEGLAAAGLPPHTLMRRAGRSVARLSLALVPHAERVWIATGPGNNGGDGLDAAIHLKAAGKRVEVTLTAPPSRLPPDAADALCHAQSAGVAMHLEPPQDLHEFDLAIDALLGIGASRAPSEGLTALIDQINQLRCPILAVDLPSGLHAGTGQPLGEACVRAQHTLTLLTVKPGLFTAHGRDFAGTVWFDDLEVASASHEPDAWLTGRQSAVRPMRRHAQHKGSFGDVAIIGGASGMTGAGVLAARAALAAGAGRTYLSLLDAQAIPHDPNRPELMCRQAWWKSPEPVLRQSTVVCGCGGGDAVRESLPRLLGHAGRLVLDADALNAIAGDSKLQALLRSRADRHRMTVLTPHPLEAARLMGFDTGRVQADRLGAAQSMADDFGCVVLLKGSGTVIGAPGLAPHINPTGSAALATAGTGDVLAGWLGGLWAQLPESSLQAVHRAACAAAYVHGAAADAWGSSVLRAGDLIEMMRAQP